MPEQEYFILNEEFLTICIHCFLKKVDENKINQIKIELTKENQKDKEYFTSNELKGIFPKIEEQLTICKI